MVGWNWDGTETNWSRKPEHYGAIHFHDDDLYDCDWQTDFSHPPAEGPEERHLLRPTHARRLEEFTPLFVRPPKGKPTSIPRLPGADRELSRLRQPPDGDQLELRRAELGALHHDHRTDQFLEETYSARPLAPTICTATAAASAHSSRLRPILNMRPKSDLWQFNADTHIIDWLAAKGLDCDIITDEDLAA